MKTIIRIDHHFLLLPDSANVNTLIKTLAQSKRVDWRPERHGDTYMIEGDPRIEVKIIQDKDVLDPKSRKRLPEKASEDCHGPGV